MSEENMPIVTRADKFNELLARWNTDEGKPYKGKLIDAAAYGEGGGLECMCAQGQVLHAIGGWEPYRLQSTDQAIADRETAKLLNISIAHAILLRNINDTAYGAPASVLTDPEKILGDQAHKVLAFWWRIDLMSAEQWAAAWDAAGAAAWDAAWVAARAAAGAAARVAARAAARDAAGAAARDAAWASQEIQGAAIMRERGQPFFFLPLFGFATPEDIPALPDNYGECAP